MTTHQPLPAACLCLVLVPTILAAGPTASAPAPSTSASRPVRLTEPALADWMLRTGVLPAEQVDESAAQQRARLQEALRRASEPEIRVQLALALANWELAEATAPALTRWILGLRTPSDLAQLGRAATSARDAIRTAERQLQELPADDDRSAQRRRTRWRAAIERLQPFASAADALSRIAAGSEDPPHDAQEAARDAAIELSELREEVDDELAAAARLWQALLLEAAGRSDRALEALGPATAEAEGMPYDFYARLLRCHILLARGSSGLVAGLTLRMHRATEKWFALNSNDAARADRTLQFVRAVAMRRWAEALEETHPELARDHRRKADQLIDRIRSSEKSDLYLLRPSVPRLVEPPDLEDESPQTHPAPPATGPTRTRPATQPS